MFENATSLNTELRATLKKFHSKLNSKAILIEISDCELLIFSAVPLPSRMPLEEWELISLVE